MIPSVRVFIAGNSGSGKTTTAWERYVSRFPRRIILDQTGEWYGRCDAYASTLGGFVGMVRQVAPRKRWTVAYTVDDDRFAELVHWLIPVPNVYASPIITVGGAVMLVDEVDLLAPQGSAPQEIRTLYRRSRHVGLSVISATQRPANVSREVSAQSTQIVAHYLSEPRDRDYMSDVMRWLPEQEHHWLEWCRRHPHGAAWKEMQTGRLLLLPERGRPRAWRVDGAQSQYVRQASPFRRAAQESDDGQASASQQREPPQQLAQPQRLRQQLDNE